MFDFDHIPFSRFGRFLTLSVMDGQVWLRSVKGGDLRPSLGRLCRIVVGEAGASWILRPDCLIAETPDGRVEFAIGEGERLHLRGTVPVTFALEGSRYDYAYVTPQGAHCVVAAGEDLRLLPRANRGSVAVSGDWRRDHAEDVSVRFSGAYEGTIDLFTAISPDLPDTGFDAAHAGARSAFADWLARTPQGGEPHARTLAAYLLWANVVPPKGMLTRPAVYMSKNAMINIWSWDNAFSALGVVAMDQGLAFDQFAAIYDHQHPSGLLPDFVNDAGAYFAFTKPPVHGWAILRLIDEHPDWLTETRRTALIPWLELQLSYWLTHARKDDQSLPAYCHGNDSGWDNATFFAEGGPVLSPDLPTFLILTCDCLARLDPARSAHWQAEGAKLSALLATLWTGEAFGTRLTANPGLLRQDESLIGFIPLLLGSRLAPDMATRLINRLGQGWITDWGPATERPQSPLYESDGYWRGPIWAPTTMLLWDGLLRQGSEALAADIALRFCRLCETSGMAENFDALTGAGLRDRAFAWTSAVYLQLSAWLAARPPLGQNQA